MNEKKLRKSQEDITGIIKSEIDWCLANQGGTNFSECQIEFQKGFIAGLKQALYLTCSDMFLSETFLTEGVKNERTD